MTKTAISTGSASRFQENKMLATKALACVCLVIASLLPHGSEVTLSPALTPVPAAAPVPVQRRGVPSDISAMWATYPR